MTRRPPRSTLFPSTPLSRSAGAAEADPPLDAGFAHLLDHLSRRLRQDVALGEGLRAHPDDALHRELHPGDRKSTRLNSSHSQISYAVFCLKKKKTSQH